MKQLLHKTARSLGFDVVHWQPPAEQPTHPVTFDVQRKMVSRDDATIFDVGAHFGAVSKIYQSLFPSATLHAFEPSPEAFDLLQRNSDGDQRHHAHRIALSDNNGIAEFSLNHASATNSLLPTDKNAPENWKSFVETENRVAVPTQTLDSFCKQHHLDRVDILKLDVQGAEGKVLAGASDLFQRQAIKAVYLEMIVASTYVGQSRPAEICRPYGPRPHRRRWSSRPSPGERWPSRLVATAAEDRRGVGCQTPRASAGRFTQLDL